MEILEPKHNISENVKEEIKDVMRKYLLTFFNCHPDGLVVNEDSFEFNYDKASKMLSEMESICIKHELDTEIAKDYGKFFACILLDDDGLLNSYCDDEGNVLKSTLKNKFELAVQGLQEIRVVIPYNVNSIVFIDADQSHISARTWNRKHNAPDADILNLFEKAKESLFFNFFKENNNPDDNIVTIPRYILGEPGKNVYDRIMKDIEDKQKAKKEKRLKEKQEEEEKEQARIRRAEKAKRKAEAKEKNKVARLFREKQVAKSKKGG